MTVSACSDTATQEKKSTITKSASTAPSQAASTPEEIKKSAESDVLQKCTDAAKAKEDAYKKNMASGEFWGAAQSIRLCANLLKDKKLLNLLKEAEVKSHISDIKSPEKSAGDKKLAFDLLKRDYPEEYEKNKTHLDKIITKEDSRAAAAEKKLKKSTGVSIGMSMQDVIDSAWGRPEKVNRTTTSGGVHEQWVYGGNNYLYFENGTLTSIQN